MSQIEIQFTPVYSGINDINGNHINDGDCLHIPCLDDKKKLDLFLRVFFDNGAFWVDKSEKQDESEGILLCEFPFVLRKVNLTHNLF